MAYPTRNKDRATFWLRKIDFSTKVLEPFFRIKDRITDLYENEATSLREQTLDGSDLGNENISRFKPSPTFAWIDQSIANLLFRNPKFRVRPKKVGSIEGANTVSNVVNYWMEETNQKKHDKRVLLDAYLGPFGVKKEGWDADPEAEQTLSDMTDLVFDDPEEENLYLGIGEAVKVMDDQDHEMHIRSHQELLKDPEIDDEIKDNVIQPHMDEHEDVQNAESSEPSIDVRRNQPFGIWVKAEDFRFDPTADDVPDGCQWIAFRSIRTLDQVRANPNYNRTAVNNLKPTTRLDGAPERDAFITPRAEDDDFGVVIIWEIWARGFPVSRNKRKDLLVVIAEQGDSAGNPQSSTGSGVVLRHDETWPYKRLRSYPVKVLSFLKSSRQWLQKPILALAGADNMHQLSNEMYDSMLSVIRKQKNIIMYDSDIINQEDMELALRSPQDLTIAVPNLRQGGGAAVVPFPFLQFTVEKMNFLELARRNYYETAGTPSATGSEDADTATEAAIRERRTTAREALRADELEVYQIGTAEDFWALHTQFRPEEEILVDPNVGEVADVTDDVVRGQYRFEIDVSSQATALAIERKQWLDLLNILSGMVPVAMQAGQPPPNLPKVVEQLLIRGYEISNPEEFWPAVGQAQQGNPQALQGIMQAAGGGSQPGPLDPALFSDPVPSEANIGGAAHTL